MADCACSYEVDRVFCTGPGCSKTTLARAAAGTSGMRLQVLSGAQLFSMYVGEGEALLRESFQRARMTAPAILFIDEIDAIVGALRMFTFLCKAEPVLRLMHIADCMAGLAQACEERRVVSHPARARMLPLVCCPRCSLRWMALRAAQVQ